MVYTMEKVDVASRDPTPIPAEAAIEPLCAGGSAVRVLRLGAAVFTAGFSYILVRYTKILVRWLRLEVARGEWLVPRRSSQRPPRTATTRAGGGARIDYRGVSPRTPGSEP